ncbi:MAG: alpha/beta hydrolase, partial [Myxococcales bacterium]
MSELPSVRIPDLHRASERPPSVDEIDFKSLYRKSTYEVQTADDWTLVITRYQPVPQLFEQPLFNEPLMLVHGFSQNRHAWTCGKFVKYLLWYGIDVHILELRGHGKSSVKLQRQKAEQGGKLPADIDYAWDLDSYFLYDLPAAVAAVKRVTRRDKIFYCGHSMGGILGYGYAGLHDDLLGLITIGAPSDLGRDFPLLKAASYMTPLAHLIDAMFYAQNVSAKARYGSRRALRSLLSSIAFARALAEQLEEEQEPVRKAFEYVPVDLILKQTEKML